MRNCLKLLLLSATLSYGTTSAALCLGFVLKNSSDQVIHASVGAEAASKPESYLDPKGYKIIEAKESKCFKTGFLLRKNQININLPDSADIEPKDVRKYSFDLDTIMKSKQSSGSFTMTFEEVSTTDEDTNKNIYQGKLELTDFKPLHGAQISPKTYPRL